MRFMGRRTCLVVAIVSFVLLAAALLIAHNSPAAGYELSIYASTPVFVWIFLILAFAGGVLIVISQVVTRKYETSRFWVIGFPVLILARVTLLCIPYIRGYESWRGDNFDHWGFLKDIVTTGHFGNTNSYPVTHTLLAQVVSVTGLPDGTVANMGTCFLSIAFVFSMYLLATAVLPNRGQRMLVTALAAVVMPFDWFDFLLIPNGWSVLLFPLLLFAVLKCEDGAYLVVALVLLLLYPFFHPLSSLMAVAALVAVVLLKFGFPYVFRNAGRISNKSAFRPILTLAGIELAILLPWLLSFHKFHTNLRMLWSQITSGTGADVIGGMNESLDKLNIHGLGFPLLMFKIYGVSLILISLSLIGGGILIWRLRSSRSDFKSQGLFVLLGLLLLYGVLYLLQTLGAPGLEAIGAKRLLAYTLIPTPVLAGYALHHLSTRFVRYGVLVFCTIMLATVLSMLALYYSPYRSRPNPQITRMDMAGMGWIVDTKDRGLGTTHIMSPVSWFANGLLGENEADQREDISRKEPQLPDHFGYGYHATLGEQYSQNTYAVISAFDVVIYNTVWKEVGRFTYSDFQRLEEDSTVAKVYSNKELDVYLIGGASQPQAPG